MKLLNTLVTIAMFGFAYVATRMYMAVFNIWISAILGAVTIVGLTGCLVAAFASFTNLLEGNDRYEVEVVRRKRGQNNDPLHKWTR